MGSREAAGLGNELMLSIFKDSAKFKPVLASFFVKDDANLIKNDAKKLRFYQSWCKQL